VKSTVPQEMWGVIADKLDEPQRTMRSMLRRRISITTRSTRGPAPQGSANLRYRPGNKTLTVATSASSLAPGGAQVGHGTCEPQGTAKYPLNDLVALASGAAYQATVIQTVDQAPAYLGVVSRRPPRVIGSGPAERPADPLLRAIICGNIGKSVSMS
jgi:hypothetical protein